MSFRSAYCVEVGSRPIIALSARKHGVSDEDMFHAYANPIRVFELDEGFTMVIGANQAAIVFEAASLMERTARSSCTRCKHARRF